MRSAKSTGRIVGVLLLAHLGAGLMAPFILLEQVGRPAGFLAGAAASPGQVRAAVLLLFAGSAVAIASTIAGLPVFRRCSSAVGLWLLALAVAAFTLQAVDNSALLSMLSLSQERVAADPAKTELFEAMAMVVGTARRWAHYAYLLVVGSWILLLHGLLYRFRLVPRALAAFGVVGSLLQIAGVTMRALLGYPPMTVLAMPLAPAYLAVAAWLMARGFDDRHGPIPAGANGPGIGGSNRDGRVGESSRAAAARIEREEARA